jgi:eukaryotic-like serine/threonine-protein kinase
MDALDINVERFAELDRQLDHALQLSVDERVHLLETLEKTDPDFASELRALLRAALDSEHDDEHTQMVWDRTITSAIDYAPGQQLGPWRLQRMLGRGGMASVWLATRIVDQAEQTAALKLLSGGFRGLLLQERMLRERKALLSLDHPNIVRMIDAGVDAERAPYFAMDYVDGVELATYLRAHKPSLERRIGIVQDIADAVSHAHSRLIIHRDLKPSNVMIDAKGQVHLLDFGIAKLMEDPNEFGGDSGNSTITREGARVYTPGFAAPEQLIGNAASTATDVYGIGCLLFYVLSGESPHRTAGVARAVLEHRTLNEDARLLSAAVLSADAAHLPCSANAWAKRMRGDLAWICAKALKRDPQQRYASVAALAQDLRNFRNAKPISAGPDSWRYRWQRDFKRHRLALTAATLAFGGVLAGTAVALWQWHQAQTALQEQIAARSFLQDVLRESLPWSLNGRALDAQELLSAAEQKLEREYAEQKEFRLDMYDSLDKLYTELGVPGARAQLLEKAIALNENMGIPQPKKYINARLSLIDDNRQKAIEDLDAVEALLDQYKLRGSLEEIRLLSLRANYNDENGDHANAAQLFAAAGQLAAKLGQYEEQATLLAQETAVHRRLKDPDAAWRAINAANDLIKKHQIHGPMSFLVRTAFAVNLMDRGEFARADALLKECRDQAELQLRPETPLYWSVIRYQAGLASKTGKYQEAVAHLQKMSSDTAHLYAEPSHYLRSLNELAVLSARNITGEARFGDPKQVDNLLGRAQLYISERGPPENEQFLSFLAKLDTALARKQYAEVLRMASTRDSVPDALLIPVQMKVAVARLYINAAAGLAEFESAYTKAKALEVPANVRQAVIMNRAVAERGFGSAQHALALREEFLREIAKDPSAKKRAAMFHILWADATSTPDAQALADKQRALVELRSPDGRDAPYRIVFGL